MKYIRALLQTLGLLGPGKAALMVAALFLNSLLEGFGIATLVPLVALALGQQHDSLPPIAQHVFGVLEMLGLPHEVWLLALLAGGALVLREVLSFFILVWASFVITDTEACLRHRMLLAIVQARWPWYHDNRLGDMSISLAQFTAGAAMAMEAAVKALALTLRTLVYLGLVVLISPVLALVVLMVAVALFGPLFLLVKLSRKYSGKHAGSTADLSAHFSDIFASIKMFKAMGLERSVRPLLEHFIRRMRKFRRRVMLTSHGLTALQNILGIVLIFSILLLAVKWLGITVVEVSVVAGLVLSVVRNLSKTQLLLQKVSEQLPYLERVEKLTRSAQAAREETMGACKPSFRDAIELRDVSFSYPGKQVLRKVSMRLPARHISVIIGPSGAGKTTIIDLITGLQQPQEGAILVDGVPLPEIDLKAWREMIGYVPQELILLSGTVRENIRLGQEVSDEDIWRALRLAGAEEFVRQLPEGLDTDLGERGVKLSGGQRQRLSLARALVRRPKLLILDEVTSALDPQTERKLVENVAELARREGITVIAITHTPAWRKVADVLVRLENGKAESCQPKVEGSCPEKT